jgi:PKD repeat protein
MSARRQLNSCKDDMPVRQFFAFCNEPGPTPDASYAFEIDDDGTVHFTNASVGGVAYHWDFGDGSTSDNENPDHTYAQDGAYQVTLIAYDDCSRDTVVIGSRRDHYIDT